MEDKISMIKYAIEELVPIHKALGLEVAEVSEEKLTLKIPYSNMVIGDSRSNRWHGGILSLAMDVTGGLCGINTFESINDKITTIDLRVDYLEAPAAEDLYIDGKIARLGNKILVTKMKAYHKSNPKVLAEGKGVYYILRESNKK